MERGAHWEEEAVRKRWASLERQRSQATRLLISLSLGLSAVVLLLFAFAPEACLADPGTTQMCVAVTPTPITISFILLALIALGGGVWLYWSNFDNGPL